MGDLTLPQRKAVEHVDGPLLILAGPGSGKTRVITRRIAHLVADVGVSARHVLAITFTNKAAGEMADRVRLLLPDRHVWVSTFHRFCARLLRQHGRIVGLESNFSILDTADQKQLLRLVMQELGHDPQHLSPAKVLWKISSLKNDQITPEKYAEHRHDGISDFLQTLVARIYPEYQRALLDSNAVDFDDLLLHTATLLEENPELREQLDARFRYILVDEYQDTNLTQYRIVAALSQVYPNLCVTGDPDQSIYGWRGARIENILRFERDFPNVKTIRLEQNFRSVQTILRSADSLISRNVQRKQKLLFSEKEAGHPVELHCFADSEAEADGIALQIRRLADEGGYRWSQFAIFYRVNALSRQLESALARHRVPFQVAAGVAFYDRTEVKDLLAYLRLIENPADRTAFLRIVNKPLRGLGKTSQGRLERFAQSEGLSLLEAARRARDVPGLSRPAVLKFQRFVEMMDRFSLANSGSVSDLLREVIDRIQYTAAWEGSGSEKDREHLENVNELVNSACHYDQTAGDDRSLQGFLEQSALANETDSLDPDAGRVVLMTLHAAKGLEFPVVFIVGLEDGLIPHERSKKDNPEKEFEEERRLLFVGMTRAQERLILTLAHHRARYDGPTLTIPSPFLAELECIHKEEPGGSPEFAFDRVAHGERATPSSPTSGERLSVRPAGNVALTTGAALASGKSVAVEIPRGFAIGAEVRHPRYGRGTVVDVGGFGAMRTVTVRFADDDRQETFVANQAPLQPLGHR